MKKLILMLLLATNSYALPVTLGTWSSLPIPNEDGNPYWDNTSWDGPQLNVGYFVPPFVYDGWEYLSYGSRFTFVNTDNEFHFLYENTAYRDSNRFGFYEIGSPYWGDIFWGADVAGEWSYPALPNHYGLWFLSPAGFYTSTANPEHFALFRKYINGGYQYIVGVEDLQFNYTDKDYNDGIYKFSDKEIPPIPEPTSLVLLGSGLLYLIRRKR